MPRRSRGGEIARCYYPTNWHERQEAERFHIFGYDDLIKRDKVSVDLFWLRDESLEGADALPTPEVLATSKEGERVRNSLRIVFQCCSVVEGVWYGVFQCCSTVEGM